MFRRFRLFAKRALIESERTSNGPAITKDSSFDETLKFPPHGLHLTRSSLLALSYITGRKKNRCWNVRTRYNSQLSPGLTFLSSFDISLPPERDFAWIYVSSYRIRYRVSFVRNIRTKSFLKNRKKKIRNYKERISFIKKKTTRWFRLIPVDGRSDAWVNHDASKLHF